MNFGCLRRDGGVFLSCQKPLRDSSAASSALERVPSSSRSRASRRWTLLVEIPRRRPMIPGAEPRATSRRKSGSLAASWGAVEPCSRILSASCGSRGTQAICLALSCHSGGTSSGSRISQPGIRSSRSLKMTSVSLVSPVRQDVSAPTDLRPKYSRGAFEVTKRIKGLPNQGVESSYL